MSIQHMQMRSDMRSVDANGEKYIEGYFAVFNQDYNFYPGYSESVDSHAFDNALARGEDVRFLINHDSGLVLGRTAAGTGELRVDEHGLYGRVKINEQDQDAMNIWARVQRGDVNQASFGFDINSETRTDREDGTTHWTINDVKLYEVSVCTFPAYEGTSLSARAAERAECGKQKFDLWKEKAKERVEKWH